MNFELMIEEAVEKAVEKALANQGKPAKATKKSKKTKASKTPKRSRIEIPGHPDRSTWTDAMRDASDVAYKALRDSGQGEWPDWNEAGLVAAKKVA
tara:strand:+ start:13393 stop:13680 length:288 start_codon:yes stop_codon:yes gene_type:complete